MGKYTSCPDCSNEEDGATIYQCKNCGRVCCGECANPETAQDEFELGTCFCDGDKNDYSDNRLFTVLGHIDADAEEDSADDDD